MTTTADLETGEQTALADRALALAVEVDAACTELLPGPQGFCRVAAELMCLRMLGKGIEDAQVVTGDYDHPSYDREGHVWVEAQGLRFDCRARQFEPDAPLVSELDDPRYTVWNVDGDEHEYREVPTRASVAETVANMYLWNTVPYARPLALLAHRLGLDLADVEPYFEGELFPDDFSDDADRLELWKALRAELDRPTLEGIDEVTLDHPAVADSPQPLLVCAVEFDDVALTG
jgi:hypothetical protein